MIMLSNDLVVKAAWVQLLDADLVEVQYMSVRV